MRTAFSTTPRTGSHVQALRMYRRVDLGWGGGRSLPLIQTGGTGSGPSTDAVQVVEDGWMLLKTLLSCLKAYLLKTFDWDAAFLLKGCNQRQRIPSETHVVVESLGLAGVFTRVSPLWSCTVQVPENTTTRRGEARLLARCNPRTRIFRTINQLRLNKHGKHIFLKHCQ